MYILGVFMLGCVYISCSAGMIAFNKVLMQPGHFPYPVYLVSIHTGSGFVLAGIIRLLKPSIFPSLNGEETHMPVTRQLLWKGAVPISALSVLYLVLSNWAYMHSSVAFLQMMKESNVALVFVFSAIAGLERFSWFRARIIFVILLATAMTIRGEINFSMLGFSIQGCSQLFESVRICLQALLLSNAGKKLDALSYTLITMPFAFMFLACIMGGNALTGNTHIPAPLLSEVQQWWPVLLANLLLAFSLNLVVALFMQHTSGVAVVLTGIVKDAAIVLVGCAALGESLSHMQVFGFALQLGTIVMWSSMKIFPKDFEGGVASGVWRLTIRAVATIMAKRSGSDEDLVLLRLQQWGRGSGACEKHEIESLISKDAQGIKTK